MGTFLLVCIIGVVACMVIGTVVGALLHALFWIITLPFRIVFKVLFGWAAVRRHLAPFVAVIAVIGLAIAAVRRPVALDADAAGAAPRLFGWTIFRPDRRSRPPAPPPGSVPKNLEAARAEGERAEWVTL
jgi:hypothetical protein